MILPNVLACLEWSCMIIASLPFFLSILASHKKVSTYLGKTGFIKGRWEPCSASCQGHHAPCLLIRLSCPCIHLGKLPKSKPLTSHLLILKSVAYNTFQYRNLWEWNNIENSGENPCKIYWIFQACYLNCLFSWSLCVFMKLGKFQCFSD